MKRVFIAGLVLTALLSCGKDKFETKPQIKLKTSGNVIVPVNGVLPVDLEFTDKEGDVDNVIFVKKERLNKKVRPTLRDTFLLQVPEFPNTSSGTIQVNLTHQEFLISAQDPPNIPGSVPPKKEADTLNIKFVLRDKAGNASDTATLFNVIVER